MEIADVLDTLVDLAAGVQSRLEPEEAKLLHEVIAKIRKPAPAPEPGPAPEPEPAPAAAADVFGTESDPGVAGV